MQHRTLAAIACTLVCGCGRLLYEPVFDGSPGLDGGSPAVPTDGSTAVTDGETFARDVPGARAVCTQRATVDRPDDRDETSLHFYYVVPAGETDRGFDVDGTLSRSWDVVDAWLGSQTGGRALRVDRCDGRLDITFVAWPSSATGFLRRTPRDQLNDLGFTDEELKVVFVETSAELGTTAEEGVGGRYAQLSLGNHMPPQSAELVGLEAQIAHFLLHSMGAAAACDGSGVIGTDVRDDPNDILATGGGSGPPWFLDRGRDTYYGHGIPDCFDVADVFLWEPASAAPQTPVRW